MKKHLIAYSIVAALVLVIAVRYLVLAQSPGGSQPDSGAAQVNPAGSDSNPVGKPEVVIPAEYQPRVGSAPQAAALGTPVYFTPQDENTSTTILFLYNTAAVTGTVPIQSFYINGSLTVSTTVAVPPGGLVRISADTVTTISGSWQKYVLINFTTFSAYAKMVLPPGVKADGYVAFDTAGFYDPLVAAQMVPLRFSTDPPTVFVPTVLK